jgi:hypothetical protein
VTTRPKYKIDVMLAVQAAGQTQGAGRARTLLVAHTPRKAIPSHRHRHINLSVCTGREKPSTHQASVNEEKKYYRALRPVLPYAVVHARARASAEPSPPDRVQKYFTPLSSPYDPSVPPKEKIKLCEVVRCGHVCRAITTRQHQGFAS